jgi:hypothetical protein
LFPWMVMVCARTEIPDQKIKTKMRILILQYLISSFVIFKKLSDCQNTLPNHLIANTD